MGITESKVTKSTSAASGGGTDEVSKVSKDNEKVVGFLGDLFGRTIALAKKVDFSPNVVKVINQLSLSGAVNDRLCAILTDHCVPLIQGTAHQMKELLESITDVLKLSRAVLLPAHSMIPMAHMLVSNANDLTSESTKVMRVFQETTIEIKKSIGSAAVAVQEISGAIADTTSTAEAAIAKVTAVVDDLRPSLQDITPIITNAKAAIANATVVLAKVKVATAEAEEIISNTKQLLQNGHVKLDDSYAYLMSTVDKLVVSLKIATCKLFLSLLAVNATVIIFLCPVNGFSSTLIFLSFVSTSALFTFVQLHRLMDLRKAAEMSLGVAIRR